MVIKYTVYRVGIPSLKHLVSNSFSCVCIYIYNIFGILQWDWLVGKTSMSIQLCYYHHKLILLSRSPHCLTETGQNACVVLVFYTQHMVQSAAYACVCTPNRPSSQLLSSTLCFYGKSQGTTPSLQCPPTQELGPCEGGL